MTLYTTNNNEGANEKVKPHLLPIHNIYILIMYWTYSNVTYCFGIPILQRFMGFAALSYKRDWSYSPWHQRQNCKIVSLYVSWMKVSPMSITVVRWCQFEVLQYTSLQLCWAPTSPLVSVTPRVKFVARTEQLVNLPSRQGATNIW